jgi:hypothetical protein
MAKRKDYTFEHLEQLIGFTVTRIVKAEDDEYTEGSYGLVLEKDGKKKQAWIDQDPEGNGPGHLDIEDVV